MHDVRRTFDRVAAIVLAASLLATFVGWKISDRMLEARAEDRFQYQTQEVIDAVRSRMRGYEQILRGSAAMLSAAWPITREHWRHYVERLDLEEGFPGTQAIGLSIPLDADSLESHVATVHAQGLSNYRIHPQAPREQYQSIVFIEPFDWRNQRALGYDMSTEPVRREAMERAMSSGEPALSGPVTLVQETDEDVQPGMLFYLATRGIGERVDGDDANEPDRRTGFAYMALRLGDLMRGVMGGKAAGISLQIHDTDAPERALFENVADSADSPAFELTRVVTLYGRQWRFHAVSSRDFLGPGEQSQASALLITGTLLSLLLFAILHMVGLRRSESLAHSRAERIHEAYTDGELRFRLVVDSMQAGVFMVDRGGRIAMANPAAQRMFGYEPGVLVGKTIEALIPMHLRHGHRGLREKGWPESGSRAMNARRDVHALRSDGTMFPVEIHLTPITVGEHAFVLATVTDITERKRRELELERSNQALEEFAHVSSHDLRAPLRAIDNLASWVSEDAADMLPDGSQRHLMLMRRRIARMEKLLDDLLVYARVHRERHPVETVDVQELFDEVRELVAPETNFVVEGHTEVASLCCARTPLRHVLINLASNAIRHHDRNAGKVRLSCGRISDHRVQICVEDDGPGIPAPFHEKVFQMYQTLQPRDELDTSGMGLALVRRIVTEFGGEVWIADSTGRGTRICFSWPSDAAAGQLADTGARAPEVAGVVS